jgi:hypothetical protein
VLAAPADDLCCRVVAELELGLSCAQVAERFGVGAASASRWRARLTTHGALTAATMGAMSIRRPRRVRLSSARPGREDTRPDIGRDEASVVPARDRDVAQRHRTAARAAWHDM